MATSGHIICSAHAERNCASVSSTDHGLLAQYGCEGGTKRWLGREQVQPASLSLHHPVIRNSAGMARKGFTQQFISLLLIRDGQGHNNVSQSDLAICGLYCQRIGIGLVPALEQTSEHCAMSSTFRIFAEFPPILIYLAIIGQYGAKILSPSMWSGENEVPHVY